MPDSGQDLQNHTAFATTAQWKALSASTADMQTCVNKVANGEPYGTNTGLPCEYQSSRYPGGESQLSTGFIDEDFAPSCCCYCLELLPLPLLLLLLLH